MKIIRLETQPESLTEMSVATRKTGCATGHSLYTCTITTGNVPMCKEVTGRDLTSISFLFLYSQNPLPSMATKDISFNSFLNYSSLLQQHEVSSKNLEKSEYLLVWITLEALVTCKSGSRNVHSFAIM